jgi:hypothetical protein
VTISSKRWKIGTGRVTAERAAHVSAGGSYSTRPSAMQNLEDESAIAQAEGSRVPPVQRNDQDMLGATEQGMSQKE